MLNDKKVADKLEACLLYYKLNEGNSDVIEQSISALNLQFANKEPLTDNMKEIVLKRFALACSLEATTAFSLLDSFFALEHRQFYHFQQLDRGLNDFMRQV